MKTPAPLSVLCATLAVACALLAGTARAGTVSNLYIPCSGNDNIQVISTAGTFGPAIPVTSPATPFAVAFDRAGNLYVANNTSPYSIEEYAPDGTPTGSFTQTTTGLNQPEGLAFDGAGNLYVANVGNNTVEKYSAAGADMGAFVSTGLSYPAGLAFNRGNLYVANADSNNIKEFSSTDGSLLNTFTSSHLKTPFRIAFDANNNFYVTDIQTNTIEAFSSTGGDQGVFASTDLDEPTGIAIDTDGTFYVCNAGTMNVEKFSSLGSDQGSIGTIPNGSTASDLALLAPGGQIEFSSATPYQTSENAGTVTITVERVNGSRGATSVTYSTTNGTATAGTDYTQITGGTLSWTDGDTSPKSFTVSIADRMITTGGTVSFMVALVSETGTGTFGSPASATVTIADNDMAPAGQIQFEANMFDAFENAGNVMVKVSRVNGTNGPVSVNYATQDGTAVANTDYTATSGTLAWSSGDGADKTITVPLINRQLTTGSTTFSVNLSQPVGTTLGTIPTAMVIINENDMPPAGQIQFSPSAYSAYEDQGTVTIMATRTGGTSGATSVSYATADGTAQMGIDYSQTNGTLMWADGEGGSKSFTVPILDRGLATGSFSFGVTLSNVTGLATIGQPLMATVTITDNDMLPPSPGVLEFSATKYSTFEDAGSVTVMVSRVNGTSGPVSVAYATVNGTAVAGKDYSQTSGTLMWSEGESGSKNIPVTILDRKITSATPVTFNVTLSAPTGGATLGTPNDPATVSITDNDALPPGQLTVTLAFSSDLIKYRAGSTTFAVGTVLQVFADISGPSSQVSQVQFTLDGTVIGTLPNTGGLYPQNVTFPDRGTHTVEAIVTSTQGGTSTGAATFTIYAEPKIIYNTAPPSVTLGLTSPFEVEFAVSDPDDQLFDASYEIFQGGNDIDGSPTSLMPDGNYALATLDQTVGQYIEMSFGLGTYQLVPEVVAKDGSYSNGSPTTVTITDSGSESASVGVQATFLAGVDHVNVPADGSLSVVVMTTSVVDSTGKTVAAVTRVDFYADGVLFASRDGNGNPIPLSTRAPAWGPITRDAPAAVDAPATGRPTLFEATYQVPANSQLVTLTAVATTSDGLSHLTAPLHVTPVVETGAPPTVTLGPLTGGQPIPAGASFEVPVTVSAPSIPVAMVQYYLNGALISAAVAPPYRVSVTPPKAGPYALTAVVTDTNGVATFAKPLAFKAVPTVKVAVEGSSLAVVGKKLGEVVFTRTRDSLSEPLTVHFKLTGTAKDGVDYAHIGDEVVIPAGKSSAKLKIKPLDTMTGPEMRELTIRLLPAPDGSYARGEKVKARLTLEQKP
jgi:hypothetical protein